MSIQEVFEQCKLMNPGDEQAFMLDHEATLADVDDLVNLL